MTQALVCTAGLRPCPLLVQQAEKAKTNTQPYPQRCEGVCTCRSLELQADLVATACHLCYLHTEHDAPGDSLTEPPSRPTTTKNAAPTAVAPLNSTALAAFGGTDAFLAVLREPPSEHARVCVLSVLLDAARGAAIEREPALAAILQARNSTRCGWHGWHSVWRTKLASLQRVASIAVGVPTEVPSFGGVTYTTAYCCDFVHDAACNVDGIIPCDAGCLRFMSAHRMNKHEAGICRLRALLSSTEAASTFALALSSIEPAALATAAKAVAKHVATLSDASRSASTQQVVTAQQHLMLALPSAPMSGGDAWGAERERLVQACLGSDEVRTL